MEVFRALCEAKPGLSFYPGQSSVQSSLVVFPSKDQLSIRAHGIASATLRRHLGDLAALVEAGLFVRKNTPKGKRFARRDEEREVDQLYPRHPAQRPRQYR